MALVPNELNPGSLLVVDFETSFFPRGEKLIIEKIEEGEHLFLIDADASNVNFRGNVEFVSVMTKSGKIGHVTRWAVTNIVTNDLTND